eukprot:TRINITY_DN2177_c0_g1_i2.p1 TRINITY_DN2177_c0_g1~~TRINITY_DN2177_c0_g1_i2.p1  ORF type:complete len:257 (+),score=25.86 TRINITY_DN2177_c0_g1_i2:202-972(+)
MCIRDREEIEAGFNEAGHGVLTGCVGALDGLALKIDRPSLHDAPDPKQFFNRKGFHALVLQAVCDHKRRFLFGSATEPGSTHDSRAFKCSTLYKDLIKNKLPLGMWIAADDAYENSVFCLTPFSTSAALKDMSPEERLKEMIARDTFNFYQSSLRISIECAFGMLVKRWGVLWRSMTGKLAHTQLIVTACMSLHNVLIDLREAADTDNDDLMRIRSRHPDGFSAPPRTWRDKYGYTQVEGRPIVYEQDECCVFHYQ